ncbi:PEP-CTERM sorting domain-containing protein [Persicirhabdus sediminis]|nr:PEP-CTERM sorting domain-containing protein [Persicirhabdus sediminis]
MKMIDNMKLTAFSLGMIALCSTHTEAAVTIVDEDFTHPDWIIFAGGSLPSDNNSVTLGDSVLDNGQTYNGWSFVASNSYSDSLGFINGSGENGHFKFHNTQNAAGNYAVGLANNAMMMTNMDMSLIGSQPVNITIDFFTMSGAFGPNDSITYGFADGDGNWLASESFNLEGMEDYSGQLVIKDFDLSALGDDVNFAIQKDGYGGAIGINGITISIPEPSSVLLLSLAGVVGVMRRRRA